MFRFLYYWQTELILLKIIKKYKVIMFLTLLLSSKISNIFLHLPQIDTIYSGLLWLFFSYFFIKLKQQKFFTQLLFTRACFYFEFEILFFISTWFIFIFLTTLPAIPFCSVEVNIQLTLSIFFTLLDALLFATSRIIIYVITQILFLTFDVITNIDYIKFALLNNISIIEIMSVGNKISILFFIKIAISIFLIKKEIIKDIKE